EAAPLSYVVTGLHFVPLAVNVLHRGLRAARRSRDGRRRADQRRQRALANHHRNQVSDIRRITTRRLFSRTDGELLDEVSVDLAQVVPRVVQYRTRTCDDDDWDGIRAPCPIGRLL